MNYSRIDRLKSLFTRELINIISTSIKEPFFEGSFVNIVDIILAKDVSTAKIYISLLDKNKEQSAVAYLQKKAGFMRGLLGKKLYIKKVPKLYFFKDDSLEKTIYMNTLLSQIKEDDESSHPE